MAIVKTDWVRCPMLWQDYKKGQVRLYVTDLDNPEPQIEIILTAKELWDMWLVAVGDTLKVSVSDLPDLGELPEIGGDPLPPPDGDGPDWCPFA